MNRLPIWKNKWKKKVKITHVLSLTVLWQGRTILNISERNEKSFSHVKLFATPWTVYSPGQNTGVGSLSLLLGIFPTQGLNPGLPHCRGILYQLSHKGSPTILEWVAYSFSNGSLASMWDECNCVVVWAFFGIGMKTDLFQSCGHCWVFQFAGILSAALSQHHLLGFEIAQLEFHHLH